MSLIDRNNEIFLIITKLQNYLLKGMKQNFDSKLSEIKEDYVRGEYSKFIYNSIIEPISKTFFYISAIFTYIIGYLIIVLLKLFWNLMNLISSLFSIFQIENNYTFKTFSPLNKLNSILNPIYNIHDKVYEIITPKILIKYFSYFNNVKNYNNSQRISYGI